MKNKTKIIARILALTFALALVVALALPCFADEQSNYEALLDYVYTMQPYNASIDVSSFDYDDYYYSSVGFWVKLDPDIVGAMKGSYQEVRYEFDDVTFSVKQGDKFITVYHQSGGLTLSSESGGELYLGDNDEFIVDFNLAYDQDLHRTYYEIGAAYINGDELSSLYDIELFCLIYNDVDFMDNLVQILTSDNVGIFYPNAYADGFIKGGLTNRPDGVVPPAKTGLFGQLYYILSDAIYGQNVELGSTQDFALTLVSTLLVLCVVLLPVLLVVAMLFKLFRW